MRYWKCIRSGEKNKFTVDKIYSTWEDGSGLIADNKESGWINPALMSKVAEFIEIKEEGENKMEDLRELIKPCYVVKFRGGLLTMVYDTQKGINFNTNDCGHISLKNLDERLIAKDGLGGDDFDVMEIYGLYEYAGGGCSKISTDGRKLIWKRTELSPTQLKLEELEKKQREIADEMEKLRKEL